MEFEIDQEQVKYIIQQVAEARKKKPLSNGPIDKIKRYDWTKDKKGYRDENGNIPYNRCFHCGYQYNMATATSAFCNICYKALAYMSGGSTPAVPAKIIAQRIRVPDEKKPVDLIHGNRI